MQKVDVFVYPKRDVLARLAAQSEGDSVSVVVGVAAKYPGSSGGLSGFYDCFERGADNPTVVPLAVRGKSGCVCAGHLVALTPLCASRCIAEVGY